MATARQIAANKANAKLSTGPRTENGKAVSRNNAVKHGLQADQLVLPGENEQDFERLCQSVFAELEPNGILEEQLVEDIAVSLWRLKRARLVETGLYSTFFDEKRLVAGLVDALGHAFHMRAANNDVFSKYVRYEKSIENSLYRAMDKLRDLQSERRRNEEDDRTIEFIDVQPEK